MAYAGPVGPVTARQMRAARGVAAAAVTTIVAATAHTLGGAGAPSPLLLAGATVMAAPLAIALIGRRPSVVRTSAAVLTAQAVFHVVFALFGDGDGIVYGPMDHASHHVAMSMAPGATAAHGLLPDAPMLGAHLVAALITIALLHRGEGLLRALARGVRRLLPAIAVAAVPHRAGAAVVRGENRPLPLSTFRFDLSRRGPPLSFG